MGKLGEKQDTLEINRRRFLKKTAAVAPIAAISSPVFLSTLKFSKEQKIKIGLIGCRGRGTVDAINCLNSVPNVELTAMGDVFEDRINKSLAKLKAAVGDKVNITSQTKFVRFDAFKGLIPTDVNLVLLTIPPHFRPLHLEWAVSAGKHVFMEKPIAVDPIGVRSVTSSSEKANEKGLTIVGGTQGRKDPTNQKAMEIIHNGEALAD